MSNQRFRRACLAGLGALALGAGMLGGAVGTAQASPTIDGRATVGAACVPASAGLDARVTANKFRKNDPNALTARQVRRLERQTSSKLQARPGLATRAELRADAKKQIVIPVAVHTIKPTAGSTNEVGLWKTRQAIRIMNRGFAGKQDKSAFESNFRFKLTSYDVSVNKRWYNLEYGSKAERNMKRSLRVGGSKTLNVYYTQPGGGLLGWATFPQWYDDRPQMDGVVINIESNKGGDAVPFNRGDTITHEVGHWLGLYHTFQGGCTPLGDRVSDTAPEAGPNFACDKGTDTCTKDGRLDPIHNFMDYSPDFCMYKLTKGQHQRMVLHYLAYRD